MFSRCDSQARHKWLMPIILPTQEEEIRRIASHRQIVQETLSQKKNPSQKKAW
jgi:hypothetical protein